MTHNICYWPKARGFVSNTYLPPSKELTLHSRVQGSHLREYGIWCVQVSCKVKRVFSCCFFFFPMTESAFFLKPLLIGNVLIFKKRWKEQLSKIRIAFFPRGCVYDVLLLEKNIYHKKHRNHHYLEPKLTNEKFWLKLLLFHISRRLRMCWRAKFLLWLLSIM